MAYGAPICTAANAQDRQSIVADGFGGAFVAWTDWRSGNEDVYALRVGPTGSIHTIFVDPAHSTCDVHFADHGAISASTQIGNPTQIRGYDVLFHIDPAVAVIANPAADIVEGPYLKSVGGSGSTAFYGSATEEALRSKLRDPGRRRGRDGGTVWSSPRHMTTVAQGESAIDITSLKLRNLENDPGWYRRRRREHSSRLRAADHGADLRAGEPVLQARPAFSNFGFDDDSNLDLAEYKIDSGVGRRSSRGSTPPRGIADGWALPGFAGFERRRAPRSIFV